MSDYDCTEDVLKHRTKVGEFINKIIFQLSARACHHDQSKLLPPEKEIFDEYTQKLKSLTYDSDEYKLCLAEMNIALKHHYAVSLHHPESYADGISDMNLISIIEMLCDWKAASEQHEDGDIFKSIEICKKRFNISDQLAKILINTVKDMF